MIKYTYGLVACLMISSTIFAGSNPKVKALEPQKQNELAIQEQELYKATTLILKNKGKNQAALKASWEELEKIDDTRDFIQDQLENRDDNR